MTSEQTVDPSETERDRTPDAAPEDTAVDLATLTVNQPLRILTEDVGSDPYNHTGRYSTLVEDLGSS